MFNFFSQTSTKLADLREWDSRWKTRINCIEIQSALKCWSWGVWHFGQAIFLIAIKFLAMSQNFVALLYSGFLQTRRNWQYCHHKLYYMKTKKSNKKILPPSEDWTRDLYHSSWVLSILSYLSELTFACKSETISYLCSHALLILTKSFKSKNQVVHEHKTVQRSPNWHIPN